MSDRRTVIRFEGSLREFEEFLRSWVPGTDSPRYSDDWDLTACISRHPAGKGLGTPVPYCPDCDLGIGHTGPHMKVTPTRHLAAPDVRACTCDPKNAAAFALDGTCRVCGGEWADRD